jgi:hypothetical protein
MSESRPQIKLTTLINDVNLNNALPTNQEMYRQLYPHAEIILWSDLYRGQKSHRIRPDMLTSAGETIPYMCKVRGDKNDTKSVVRLVIFDIEYAQSKLSSELKDVANALSLEDFIQLMIKVYDYDK